MQIFSYIEVGSKCLPKFDAFVVTDFYELVLHNLFASFKIMWR